MEEDRIIEIAIKRIEEANERTVKLVEAMYEVARKFNQPLYAYAGQYVANEIEKAIHEWKEKNFNAKEAGEEPEESQVSD